MNATPPIPPRRRLQELLAIPERLRTEAQWDELHELEISLAPGNRADSEPPRQRQNNQPSAPRPRPTEGGEVKKPFRKRQRKPSKPGGAGGPGGPAGPTTPTE